MAITLRELVTKWTFDVQQAPLNRAEKSIQNIGRLARNTALLITGNALGLGAFFRTLNQFEQAEVAFDVLIGDLERSRQLVGDLEQFARRTPFTLVGINEAAKQLLAFRFQANEIIPALTALGNVSAAVGRDKLPRLILALGQVRTAGRLRGQELRQFTEAGVGLVAALSELTGKTEKEVADLIPKGAISFDLVNQAIQKVATGTGRFAGLMERQAQTIGGLFSNIVDTVQLTVKAVGEAGLLGEARAFLRNILSFLETGQKEIIEVMKGAMGALIILAKSLGSGFLILGRILRAVASVVGGTERAMALLANSIVVLIGLRLAFHVGVIAQSFVGYAIAARKAGLATLFLQGTMALIPLAITGILVSLALLAEDIIGFFQGKDSITGRLIEAFKMLEGKVGGIGDTLNVQAFVEGGKQIKVIIDQINTALSTTASLTERVKAGGGFLTKLLTGGLSPQGLIINTVSGIIQQRIQQQRQSTVVPNSPVPVPAAGGVGGINMPVTINANGLNAGEAQGVIIPAVEEAMNRALRQGRRDAATPIER